MASAGEKALHAALKKREFDPVYYFHGDDDFLKDERVRELIDAAIDPATRDFNLEVRRGGDLSAEGLDSLLGTPPMLADRRVVVIRDIDKVRKDARHLLDVYLARPSSEAVVVLVSGAGVKVDKALSGRATTVEFTPLTGDRIARWISYHADAVLHRAITPGAVSLLIEAAGEDLARLAVELEKLASYADGAIDEVAVSEVVGIRRGETMGDLLDAIAARDASTALRMLPDVLQQPKNGVVPLIMFLTTQTLALGHALAARSRGNAGGNMYNEFAGLLKETGAFPGRPWGEAFASWSKHSARWTAADIDAGLTALLAADEAAKETKLSSDEQLARSLVLSLCGTASPRPA